MAVETSDQLLAALTQSKVLEPARVSEIRLTMTANFPDPKKLARELIRREWLTPFQVNQIFRGEAASLLLGPYVLQERLAHSPTGQVYKARHHLMNRVVSLKVIREDVLADQKAVDRFYSELQAASRLAHPNIVHAYDAGPVGRTHFFAAEFVDGIDLDRLLNRSGPLPMDLACDFVCQIALALQHAYERDMLHYDLKATNVLVTRLPKQTAETVADRRRSTALSSASSDDHGGPGVKVCNLGLTLFRPEGEESLDSTPTSPLRSTTTADFVAPERGDQPFLADVRSDLYSLGCLFFFMLTNQVPFPGGTRKEKLLRHRTEVPMPIELLHANLPPDLVGIITKLLAKDPAERFQTPLEVAAATASVFVPPGQSSSNGVSEWQQNFDLLVPPPDPLSDNRLDSTLGGSTVRFKNPPTGPSGAFPAAADAELLASPGPPRTPVARGEKNPAAAPSRRLLYVVGGVVVLAIVGGLGLGFVLFGRPTVPPARTQPAGDAGVAGEFRRLRERVTGSSTGVAAARAELLEFRRSFPATPEALAAMSLFGEYPSPLDRLSPASVPEPERFRGIVGVLGTRTRQLGTNTQVLAVSPDGRWLATASPDNWVKLWDRKTLDEKAAYLCPAGVGCLAFSPDSQWLSFGANDGIVRSWPVAAAPKEPPGQQAGVHKAAVTGLAFSPDGKRAVSSSLDGTLHVFDLTATPPTISELQAGGPVTCVAIRADGGAAVCGTAREVAMVWELPSGRPLGTMKLLNPPEAQGGPPGFVSVTFFPDGSRVLACGTDLQRRVWDLKSSTLTPIPCVGPVSALSPSGTLLALADTVVKGGVSLWDLTAQPPAQRAMFLGHHSAVLSLAFADDGKTLFSAGSDWYVREWDTGKVGEVTGDGFNGHFSPPTGIAPSPDGSLLYTGSSDRTLRVWRFDGPAGRETATVKLAWGVTALVLTPEGKRLVTGEEDGTLRLWAVDQAAAEPRELASLRAYNAAVTALAVNSDGSAVYSAGGDGGLLETPIDRGQFRDPTATLKLSSPARFIALTPDRQTLLTAGGEMFVRVWKLQDARWKESTRLTLPGLPEPANPNGLALSPDGHTFISAFKGKLTVWNLPASGPVAGPRTLDSRATPRLVFSPDGRSLAGGGSSVYQCSPETGEPFAGVDLPFWTSQFAVATDNRHIFVGSSRGQIFVFRSKGPVRLE